MLIDLIVNIFSGEATYEYIVGVLAITAGFLFSLSLHELAHGFAAYTQGDGYAKAAGRLTLNPFKHLDPIGTVMMLLCGFGWAKPVPIVPNNFKNGKKSMFIVALAGVVCNITLAFILIFLLYFLLYICKIDFNSNVWLMVLYLVISMVAQSNIALCIFNLIPIPPLDGYRVVKEIFINYKNQYTFIKIERFSMIFSIGLMLFLSRTNILGTVVDFVFNGFHSIMRIIFGAYM